jgi:ketosteroid isomerase-like protein
MVRGKSSITEYYVKDAAGFAATGGTVADDPVGDVGQSGDLAWQSGTYKNTDKTGSTLDSGKFLTVFQRRDGKWVIIRDTWNSDVAPATHVATAPTQ